MTTLAVLSRFHITVAEARELVDADLLGKSDPTLKLSYGTQTFQTSVKNGTLNPVWNERFTFNKEGTSSAILLNMFDKDLFSSEAIGSGVLNLDGSFLNDLRNGPVERWVPLTSKNASAGRVRVVVNGEFVGTGYSSPTGASTISSYQTTTIPTTTTSYTTNTTGYTTGGYTTSTTTSHNTASHYATPGYGIVSSFVPGTFLNAQPVGTHNFRKSRWQHGLTWETANTAWTADGWSKCLTHETASSERHEWKLMLAPWDTIITVLQGEVTYDIKGTHIVLGVGDELIIPAHAVYHLKVSSNHNAILVWAYKGDFSGHGSQHTTITTPVAQPSSGVAVRSTIEARSEAQARSLDALDGKIDGKYHGDTIHAAGSAQYGQRGTWEASDSNMAKVVDGLDRSSDGRYAGSRVVVSRDGYVDGRI